MNCHNSLEGIQELYCLGGAVVIINKVNEGCGKDRLIKYALCNNTILDADKVLRFRIAFILLLIILTVGHVQVEGREENTNHLLSRPLHTLLHR